MSEWITGFRWVDPGEEIVRAQAHQKSSDYVYVQVGPKLFTKIDPEDAERFSGISFRAKLSASGSFYVVKEPSRPERRMGVKTLHLSRAILNAPDGLYVDHINGDTLDNRRSNLRLATSADNSRNRPGTNGRQFKGCYPHQKGWHAKIQIGEKRITTKDFPTKREAAAAYNYLALKFFGDFARLNILVGNFAHVEEYCAEMLERKRHV